VVAEVTTALPWVSSRRRPQPDALHRPRTRHRPV